MVQKTTKEKEQAEHQRARIERQEFQAELATHAEQVVTQQKPRNLRRVILLSIVGLVALLAGLFVWLVLLPSPAQTPRAGIAVGTAAPEFTLPVYGGQVNFTNIDLYALRGHPVILNFWSESCGPCRAEVPYIQRTYAQYGANGDFTVLGINQADPKDDIKTFGADFKVSYPLLFDQGGHINTVYEVTAIPTTYFIDSNGIVRSVFITQLTTDTMHQGLASVGIIIP